MEVELWIRFNSLDKALYDDNLCLVDYEQAANLVEKSQRNNRKNRKRTTQAGAD